jgi:hypothetical protein
MKCIKRNNEVARVTDSEAAEKVKNGWSYIPKSKYWDMSSIEKQEQREARIAANKQGQ